MRDLIFIEKRKLYLSAASFTSFAPFSTAPATSEVTSFAPSFTSFAPFLMACPASFNASLVSSAAFSVASFTFWAAESIFSLSKPKVSFVTVVPSSSILVSVFFAHDKMVKTETKLMIKRFFS